LASLQVPDEKLPEVHEEEAAEPTLPKGPNEEVAEELHGLVKVCMPNCSLGKALYLY
jgi:hypothetical protein